MGNFFSHHEIESLTQEVSYLEFADDQTQKSFLIEKILQFSQKLRNEPSPPDNIIREFLKRSGQPDSYLAKLLGSRSRASEILAGKRNLSISDLRVLRDNLGIPPDLLLGYPKLVAEDENYSKYPVPELVKYNFLSTGIKRGNKGLKEIIDNFFDKSGFTKEQTKDACFRQSIRKNEKSNIYSLQAWLAAVSSLASNQPIRYAYRGITNSILQDLVKLSIFSDGPKRALHYLKELGINIIILPHFQKTYLDGAIFKINDMPIIGLTIRYDRVDNFWHTLLHELCHLALGHLDENPMLFDDMEIRVNNGIENDADEYAKNIYISKERWEEFKTHRVSVMTICELANEIQISPAIIAGRYRYETGKYKMFNTLIGYKEVRRHFEIFS